MQQPLPVFITSGTGCMDIGRIYENFKPYQMSQNNIDLRIQHHLEIFKKRPRVFVQSAATYILVQNYIEGYLDGLSVFLKCDMRFVITRWYAEKNNIEGAIDLTDYILVHFAGKSEKELRHILIDAILEYFKERPVSR
jgi:hypothetical protein